MNIGVIAFENEDVSEGLKDLFDVYSDLELTVFIPVTEDDQDFIQSVLRTCIEAEVKVTAFIESAEGLDHLLKQADDIVVSGNPVKEVVNQLKAGDALAIAWDDSPQSHVIIHAVEDLALDTWDISHGLIEIDIEDIGLDIDTEGLHDLMHQSLGTFIEALAAFVASTVMESLSQAVDDHMRDSENKKDISPFKDDE